MGFADETRLGWWIVPAEENSECKYDKRGSKGCSGLLFGGIREHTKFPASS